MTRLEVSWRLAHSCRLLRCSGFASLGFPIFRPPHRHKASSGHRPGRRSRARCAAGSAAGAHGCWTRWAYVGMFPLIQTVLQRDYTSIRGTSQGTWKQGQKPLLMPLPRLGPKPSSHPGARRGVRAARVLARAACDGLIAAKPFPLPATGKHKQQHTHTHTHTETHTKKKYSKIKKKKHTHTHTHTHSNNTHPATDLSATAPLGILWCYERRRGRLTLEAGPAHRPTLGLPRRGFLNSFSGNQIF